MQRVPFGSHIRITATLTDENGDPVTGAEVTLTVTDRGGASPVDGQAMTDDGGGEYSYLATPAQLTRREHRYTTKVTAVSGANVARYAEGALFTAIDAD